MSVMEAVIGWLAPPTCVGCGLEGSTVCLACSATEILPYGERCWNCGQLSARSKTCQACRANGSPNYLWICTDYEGPTQNLIQKYKFSHQRAAVTSLAQIMAETLLSQNSDQQIDQKNYVIVPVPTASSRVRQRSFDHTYLLAKHISKTLKLPVRSLLGRIGQNQQIGSNRQIRVAQAKNSYFPKSKTLIKGRNILLIDDVLTTGSTLAAAATALRQAGARSVDALVFAKRL